MTGQMRRLFSPFESMWKRDILFAVNDCADASSRTQSENRETRAAYREDKEKSKEDPNRVEVKSKEDSNRR